MYYSINSIMIIFGVYVEQNDWNPSMCVTKMGITCDVIILSVWVGDDVCL